MSFGNLRCESENRGAQSSCDAMMTSGHGDDACTCIISGSETISIGLLEGNS